MGSATRSIPLQTQSPVPASRKGRRAMLKTFPVLAALAVTAALVVPNVSQAEETDSVRVPYADLNLLASPDQARLQRRIAFAAEVVCWTADHRDVPFLQKVGECRRGTV